MSKTTDIADRWPMLENDKVKWKINIAILKYC